MSETGTGNGKVVMNRSMSLDGFDSKTPVSGWNRSSDRDASAGVKPHSESCCIGQALEQAWDDGPFRDEAPVIRPNPRQQVSVTDD